MSKYSEDETLLDEEKQLLVAQWRREIDWHKLVSPVQRILPLWPWIGHVFLLSISSVMFFMSFLASTASPSDLVITQRVSAWSPVAPLVRYDTVRYNLTPIIHSSPYVGKGLDVDEAWEQISRVGDTTIDEEEVLRLGLPLDSIKITDPRTGEIGYRAAVEVFHQLHCLNLIRQFTWREYYVEEGGDISDEPEDVRGHVDHCLETLRINLMCQSDIGLFTFKLYPELGDDLPWPIFSTLHTCRNFDTIRDWARNHAVTWDDNA